MNTDNIRKPCPFCGSEGRLSASGGFVECKNRDCAIGGYAIDVEQWNRRPESSRGPAQYNEYRPYRLDMAPDGESGIGCGFYIRDKNGIIRLYSGNWNKEEYEQLRSFVSMVVSLLNPSPDAPTDRAAEAVAPEQFKHLRGEERELAVHRQDCPKAWDFFQKHAGLTVESALPQSCFKCGKVGERAIQHLELPNIYICAACAHPSAPNAPRADAIDSEAMRFVLREACDAVGSQKAWADGHNISEAYVSDILARRREVSAEVALFLGYHKQTIYTKDKP